VPTPPNELKIKPAVANIKTGIVQAHAAPARAITAAQMAGPKMRAMLKDIAVSPTALGSASRGTSIGTNAKRIGLCIADTEPNAVAKIKSTATFRIPR